MIEPEKPPLRMANSTSRTVSLRKSRLGPSVRSFWNALIDEPWVAAALSVWQPPQRSWNSTAPWWTGLVGWLLSASIFLVPQAEIASVAAAAAVTTQNGLGGGPGGPIYHPPAGPRGPVGEKTTPPRGG